MPDPSRSLDPIIVTCPACATANRVPAARLTQDGKCGRCASPLFTANPIVLGAASFDRHAVTSDVPLLVDFWAGWCGPCRQMAPAFEAAAAQLEPQVRLGKIDTESEQAIAARYAIRSIPTLVLIRTRAGGRPAVGRDADRRNRELDAACPGALMPAAKETSMTDDPGSHTDALKYEDWSGEMGARWLANLTGFESTIAPVGQALLARAGYRAGERVVDIGFGGGASSLEIAAAVGPQGEVVGIDISPELVAATTRRAAQAGIGNARFVCADAATVTLGETPFDRLFSRFGSMFFPDPTTAFANLRQLLRRGGRIDLAVWGPPSDNPWMTEGMAIARQHVELPAPVPRAPGPFAFEESDYLRSILDAAGFEQVDIVAATGLLPVGGPGATAVEAQQFARSALAFGQVLLDYPDEVQATVAGELTALYARHHQPGQGVMMSYKAWLVSARA